jgi:cyclopropane-fatty-acyl-phospholipid synthase
MNTTQAQMTFAHPSRQARLLESLLAGAGVSCEVQFQSGEILRVGAGNVQFRVTVHDDRSLLGGLDELSLAEAYVEGKLDFDGDMLSLLDLRMKLKDKTVLRQVLKFWSTLLFRNIVSANQKAIALHYNFGDDFYLCFMDSKYRLYSHGIFESDSEPLETGCERKLDTAYDELNLSPGMRILDIGGGWGGATEYFGRRGVHVTSLTIAQDSFRFISRLIETHHLPCEVLLEDFLGHRPAEPYDAIVIFGVIEHIPNYREFAKQAWNVLKPGGSVYLDGSASKEKYDMSSFTRKYIWPGTHTFMSLPDVVQEVLNHGFELVRVQSETHDYEITAKHWAERFESNRERIVKQWGEALYRAFGLYLWGTSHAFRRDLLQAYHLVARKTIEVGPRPGRIRRVRSFARNIMQ